MFEWHKEAQKKWDDRADYWNQNSQEMWDEGSRSTILPFFKKHVQSPCKVLDVGCGDGYGSYKLNQNGYYVTGLDISGQMIEKAKTRGETNKLNFVQGDVRELAFSNHEFDAIMAINSLEWTEVPLKALLELKRVVKLGGYLCIGLLGPTAMPRANSFPRLYEEEVICNTMMPWELEQLATENGLTVIDGHGVYKKDVTTRHLEGLPNQMKQALTFMWVFMMRKNEALEK
ncbi:class I SAM-dependent methyltransferase [Bacillus salitolerans]|uniref:Class I SAM-dependent methyltransferase n=1 Tax=Bacillus salitolerans TaxID=1437434 RepID=A0ABW4LTK2_9BACI